ncbi:MAG: hypothetical protein JRI68_34080 [Deltaproteobacteria bacterium]|nr:hypothetical protein [Deltaproteobacteria bacterium]
MRRTNRTWLPSYSHPEGLLPKIQETRALFSRRPYPFPEFVGKAVAFLNSGHVKKMGFQYDPKKGLPCKWKCSDESLYVVDLALYAQTGHYPFDKGLIGGRFNASALGAAVHHASTNLDFGGSHVGYVPGPKGGTFGTVWRPLQGERSSNCGYLMALLRPFRREYSDATENILIYQPPGEKVIVSVPNEFVQPNWSARRVKLLVDTETLTAGEVEYVRNKAHTHTPSGRTLFYLSAQFLDGLRSHDVAAALVGESPRRIGAHLTHPYFNIFDVDTEVDAHGLPKERLLLYMKYILAARHAPPPLKAAIINTNIEQNHLTDTIRAERFSHCSFASFSGVFVDFWDDEKGRYAVLFQPLAIAILPAGAPREFELMPDEIHHRFAKLKPAEPVVPMANVLRGNDFGRSAEQFTFDPENR